MAYEAKDYQFRNIVCGCSRCRKFIPTASGEENPKHEGTDLVRKVEDSKHESTDLVRKVEDYVISSLSKLKTEYTELRDKLKVRYTKIKEEEMARPGYRTLALLLGTALLINIALTQCSSSDYSPPSRRNIPAPLIKGLYR